MADPYKNNVVLYLPMEGTRHGDTVFVDKTGKTATRVGTPVLQGATGVPEPFGVRHMYNPGNGSYISFAACPDFDFGAGDWTIEGWILSGVAADREWIAHRHTSDFNNVWFFRCTSTGALRFFAKATSVVTDITTTTTLSLDTWYHVAAVRRSGIVSIFVNGVLQPVTTTANSTSAYVQPNYPLLVGAADNSGTGDWLGYIKDLRITKGVARYTGNFTVSQTTTVDDDYWANVVLGIHGEGTGTTFTDVSNSAKTITTYGNTTHSTAVAPPFGTSSIYFDGSGDYLSLADSADFAFGSGDFTIECWVYIATAIGGGSYPTIVSQRAAYNSNYSWIIFLTTNDIYFYCSSNGTADFKTISSTHAGVGVWAHFAVVRYGDSLYLFRNGVRVNTVTGLSTTALYDSSSPVRIGATDSAVGAYFNGYIKDLRVTKGIARYTQNFTPKYAPFPDKTAIKTIAKPLDWDEPEQPRIMHGVAALSRRVPIALSEAKRPPFLARRPALSGLATRIPTYMKSESARAPVLARRAKQGGDPYFNNVVLNVPLRGGSALDSSKYGRATTVSGDVSLRPDFAYFAGTADMVKVAGTAHSPQGTEDFTIECWVQADFAGIDREVCAQRYDGGDTQNFWNLRKRADNTLQAYWKCSNATAINVITTGTVPAYVWCHLAVVRKDQVVSVFIDGKKQALGTEQYGSSSLTTNAAGLTIGASDWAETGNYGWVGYIRDFRITRGAARYTSNFTPPAILPTHGVPSRSVTAFAAPASPISSALSAIYQDALLQWALSGGVYREAPYQWNTLNSALRAAQADWHLVNAAQRDAQLDWHTIAAAYRELIAQWDDGGWIANTAQLDWHKIGYAERDAITQWIVAIAVDNPATLGWTLCIAAERSAEARWELLKAVERDRTLSWHKISYVLRDNQLNWSMLEHFIHEGRIDWNLANSAEAQAELAWALVQAAERDADIRFHLANAAAADIEGTWNVLSAAVRDVTARWDLIGAVLRSMDASWDTIMGVSRDSEAAWNVAIAAAQQLESAWNALGHAAKDAVIQWEKVGYTDRGIEVAWKIIPLYGSDGPPEYTVLITAENRAVSIEFESRSREVPAELRTLRVPPADDDTYGKL